MKIKNNSKDYLLELANDKNTDEWLKWLIYETINTNANIDKLFLEKIYDNLIKNKEFSYIVPKESKLKGNKIIKFLNLTHRKWVNALSWNQIIKFSDNITILHWLNWVWKSGYFKILNELSWWKQVKNIIPNIYKNEDNQEVIDVELKYKIENKEKILNWDWSNRDLEDLNNSKVFDTSYMDWLLSKRESDETLIQPFLLHFFEYIITNIDELKNKIKNESQNLENKKPNINLDCFSEEIENIFLKNKINKDLKEKLEKLYLFSEEDEEKLFEITKNIKILNQENIQDKIIIETRKKEDIENFIKNLKDVFFKLSEISKKIPNLIKEYNKKLEESLKFKNQINVLKDIPQSNSESWKTFIKAWQKYSKNINSENKKCIYCFQDLKDDSLKIIKSYTQFLDNNSEQELLNLKKEIKKILDILNNINTNLLINNDLVKIFDKENIKHKDKNKIKTLHIIILEIIKILKEKKDNFIIDLKDKKIKSDYSISLDWTWINESFIDLVNKQKKSIKELSKNKLNKDKKILELNNEKRKLIQNKNISSQKKLIKEWININNLVINLKEKESKITTLKITNLSTKAHNELLTENLKTTFKKELKWLWLNLDIELKKVWSSKWKVSNELIISQNHSINNILSEWEQKAVALALFISESKISKINAPIIFDDPINSLDHKIASYFTERLLLLENQIIIFNHNKLFIDTFETSKDNHICKDINWNCRNSKWKHISIYEVISEWKNSKWILKNYKKNDLKNNLKEIDKLLKKSPFDEHEKVSSLLRKSIECYIDEKILNRQVPTKYSNKNNRIDWNWLKEIKIDKDIINKLKEIHSRLSWWILHNWIENEENPIELEEFKKIYDFLYK